MHFCVKSQCCKGSQFVVLHIHWGRHGYKSLEGTQIRLNLYTLVCLLWWFWLDFLKKSNLYNLSLTKKDHFVKQKSYLFKFCNSVCLRSGSCQNLSSLVCKWLCVVIVMVGGEYCFMLLCVGFDQTALEYKSKWQIAYLQAICDPTSCHFG